MNSGLGLNTLVFKVTQRDAITLTAGSIYKCKQFPFDSTDETLVYLDDLQLGNNFVSDGQFFNGFCPLMPKRVNICLN